MKSKTYYRTRTLVRSIFWASLLVLIYLVATRLWWVDNGFCFNTLDVCMGVSK